MFSIASCVIWAKRNGNIDSGKLTILSPHQKCDIKHWVLEITRADIHDDSFTQIAQLFSKILIPKWSMA